MVFKLYVGLCLCSKTFGIVIKQIRQGQFSVPISAAVVVDDMGTRYEMFTISVIKNTIVNL